jgi:hypothetical protein
MDISDFTAADVKRATLFVLINYAASNTDVIRRTDNMQDKATEALLVAVKRTTNSGKIHDTYFASNVSTMCGEINENYKGGIINFNNPFISRPIISTSSITSKHRIVAMFKIINA